MVRKSLISLGLLMAIAASVTCAMADSTIYTDDLGRMHFLGKDLGGKTLQQMPNYNNPNQMNINNGEITRGLSQSSDVINTPPNACYPQRRYKTVTNVQPESKATGSFTFNKGAMDASNPYTYGETNIKNATETKTTTTETKKKHFWNK